MVKTTVLRQKCFELTIYIVHNSPYGMYITSGIGNFATLSTGKNLVFVADETNLMNMERHITIIIQEWFM